MATNISLGPPPTRTPVVGENGLVSTQWNLWLQQVFLRIGGGSAPGTADIATELATLQTDVTSVETTQAGQTATVAGLQATVKSLSTNVTDLQTTVGSQQQQLAVQRGTWVPAFTGAAETGSVAYAGTWESFGDQLFWEVEIDATAGAVTFTGAQLTNMPVPAALDGVFGAVNTSAGTDYGQGFVEGSAAHLPDFTVTAQKAVLAGRYVR